MTASRAATYAGPRPARAWSGSGVSTSPMPIPMFQASARSSALERAGERGRVVEHALELVADGALEGESGRGTAASASSAAGTWSGRVRLPSLVHGEHHDRACPAPSLMID